MRFRGAGRPAQFVPIILTAIIVVLAVATLMRVLGGRSPRVEVIPVVTPAPHRMLVHPWSPQDRRRLAQAVDRQFAPVLGSRRNGFVMLAPDGSVLYDHNSATALAPASTLKVLTAATALSTLGAGYRFTTTMAALDDVNDGVLDGDLYLIGGGDPSLAAGDIHNGIGSLYQSGLRKIMGHVVIDDTAFGGPEQNPHWASEDLNLDYAAGTNALSLDDDVEVFHVIPNLPNIPAQVRLDPANAEAQLIGHIMTAPAGSGGSVHIDHVEGVNQYKLSGSIDAGAEQRFPIPVGDIGSQVGGVMDGMLTRRGIAVSTPARIDAAPLGAKIVWTHHSAPLRDLVHHMLVVSDNHYAEQLLRTVAAAGGHTGIETQGIAIEAAMLARLGVEDHGLRIFDGSGLSPTDRISPRSLAAVIADAASYPGSALISGLPRVGMEGTVQGHSLHRALGRVRAKSGHIEGVDGLAGIIETPHHGPIAFAFITNDADDATIEDAEDAVFEAAMSY